MTCIHTGKIPGNVIPLHTQLLMDACLMLILSYSAFFNWSFEGNFNQFIAWDDPYLCSLSFNERKNNSLNSPGSATCPEIVSGLICEFLLLAWEEEGHSTHWFFTGKFPLLLLKPLLHRLTAVIFHQSLHATVPPLLLLNNTGREFLRSDQWHVWLGLVP